MVGAAHRAGLTALALTDHDSIAGVAQARSAGGALGVRIVAGAELSAYDGDREIHILGLHLSALCPLERQLVALRATRQERAREIVAKLAALGVSVSLDRVFEIAGEGAIGRPHVALALMEAGHVGDRREAFDRFLGSGKPAFVAKHRLSIQQAVEMIHRAGGLAVLAHPGGGGTREWLTAFREAGGDGAEVRHPGHSAEDTARLGSLVEEIGLLPSGGSDCHGAAAGPRALGSMRVPAAWLERQEARVRELAAEGRVA